ncbi:AraC family transcriptional regulator [Arthrobacter sp. cf158]|uniref:AraC family transcriptional regulator n=1 Tax=Arthrobacter sp. cf158 TaxID=1761744 RepID=UPI001587902C|nr:AraC family transcriptional regulator [Arthrobacter sp. cf158]
MNEHQMLITGNLAALTLAVPDDSRVIAVLLPAGAKDLPLQTRSAGGRLINDRRGSTSGILAHILRGLAEDDHGGFHEHDRRVCDQLSVIVRMACAEEKPEGRSDTQALFTASTEIIENRLWDDAMDAEALAARLNVSTRTLHRAFRAQGASISMWIRERRLDRCRQDLQDPAFSHLPVSSIAAQWGLRDAAHFSRLFKARFGESPRSFRVTGRQYAESFDGHLSTGSRVFA